MLKNKTRPKTHAISTNLPDSRFSGSYGLGTPSEFAIKMFASENVGTRRAVSGTSPDGDESAGERSMGKTHGTPCPVHRKKSRAVPFRHSPADV